MLNPAQLPEEVRAGASSPAAAQGCERLQTAAGPGAVPWDGAPQLWSHCQRGTEPAPAWISVLTGSHSVIPTPLPLSSLPGITA